ncbi:molybdopterin-dependent oxidoreductase [Acidobacteriota bacterium]
MSKKDISRREFMKVGMSCLVGAAANAGALQGQSKQHRASGAVSRTSLKYLRGISTTCQQCPAGCGVVAYLDGDRLVQIQGNPKHPNNKGGICAKAISGINLANDPERLLFPLKRVGPRGKGEWTRITWDEVYHTLSKRILNLKAAEKMREFVVDKGRKDLLLDRFLSSAGIDSIIDRPLLKNWNRTTAIQTTVGTPDLIEDVENSRMILNFGANPYANHDHFITMARRLVQARTERGARLITFDVRMSETAAKSDDWYPLKAGTDGVVALAMAKVIVDRNLADAEFLKTKTDITLAQLKHHVAPYTLEKAEKISGLSSTDIEAIALDFATQKPSIAMSGGGVSDHINGVENVRCVNLLNWLVGNLNKKGGLLYPALVSELPSDDSTGLTTPLQNGLNLSSVKDILESKNKIDTYFMWMANPAYSDPDCQNTEELLKDEASIPFVVVMDTHITETAMLADMVLPGATFLEGWSLEKAHTPDGAPILNLNQPAVSLQSPAKVLRSPHFDVGKLLEPVFWPKGESQEIGNLCLELARRTGGELRSKLPFTDTQDFVRQELFSIPGFDTKQDFESIKRHGFWIKDKPIQAISPQKSRPPITLALNPDKKTGQAPLPEYRPVSPHQRMQSNEFILTSFKSNLWSSGNANSKWTQEIMHENPIWINRSVAQKMGIRNGERVRISSNTGSLITRVITTGRIHPKSAAIAEGHGHTAFGHIAKAQPFKSKDLDTRLIWWGKQGNGVNPMIVTEKELQSSGGCHAYKDTVIKIEKL